LTICLSLAGLGVLSGGPLWTNARAVEDSGVFFQAHRGGLDEVPENTMAAFRRAWGIEGAVPEVDVRATRDGVLVCLHDETPARTTNAPAAFRDKAISAIDWADVRQWDAGAKFSAEYAGERVPRLEDLFEEMKGRPARRLYLDLKAVNLDALKALIEEYGVVDQLIFVHGSQEALVEIARKFPGTGTMTWLSGTPDEIKQRFEELDALDFAGITQLQFHLRPRRRRPEITYVLEPAFLEQARKRLDAAGVALQLRPFVFDGPSLRRLMDLGVRWFVADAPAAFAAAVREAQAE